MTQQEIFDHVYSFLWKQGAPGSENGTCRYRTEDGRKCAVGCLIPDELYDPKIEGETVEWDSTAYMKEKFTTILEEIGVIDQLEFLARLQNAHDDIGFDKEFLLRKHGSIELFRSMLFERMKKVADFYGLQIPETKQ